MNSFTQPDYSTPSKRTAVFEPGKVSKEAQLKAREGLKRPSLIIPTPESSPVQHASCSLSHQQDQFSTPKTSFSTTASPKSMFSTPITETCQLPISPMASPMRSSPTLLKYLPISASIPQQDVESQIEDSLIDDVFKFDVSRSTIIGRGSYSTVLQCSCKDNLFAIKIPTSVKTSKWIFKEMLNYKIFQNHAIVNHWELESLPVLNVYGITMLDRSQYPRIRYGETVPCIVSERLSYSLTTLAESQPATSTTELHIGSSLWWRLARQILTALQLLNDCHLVHMDIKPANVLFDNNMSSFKLCDLTSAALQEDVISEYHTKLQLGAFYDVTPQYCAPELMESPPHYPSYSSDLFAAGLTLLYAATGEQPYSQVLSSVGVPSVYVTECIKKNKALELVSPTGIKRLQSDTRAFNLIQRMIVSRASLAECMDIVNHSAQY